MSDEPYLDESFLSAGLSLIEASAGTGKTTALEKIYLKLIEEKDYSPGEILITTFAKKASHEIRERLWNKLLLGKNDHPAFQNAYRYFSQVSIGTVHSLFQQILQELNQREGNPPLQLSESEKHYHRYEDRLWHDFLRQEEKMIAHDKLFHFAYQNFSDKSKNQDFQKFIETLQGYHQETDFLPQLEFWLNSQEAQRVSAFWENPPKELHLRAEEWCHCWNKLVELVWDPQNIPDFFTAEKNPWGLNKLAGRLYHRLKKRKTLQIPSFSAQDLSYFFYPPEGESGFFSLGDLSKHFNKNAPPPLTEIITLFSLEKTLIQQRRLFLPQEEKNPLERWAWWKLIAYLLRNFSLWQFKKRRLDGRYQFSDLVEHTKNLVMAPQNPLEQRFVEELQQRWKVILIDEFQDTDAQQWAIFETLFLQSSKQALVIVVGDPKQSIYAFRDVDISLYYRIKKSLNPNRLAELTTNYRAHPELTRHLNILFQEIFFKNEKSPLEQDFQPSQSPQSPPSGSFFKQLLLRGQLVRPLLWTHYIQAQTPQKPPEKLNSKDQEKDLVERTAHLILEILHHGSIQTLDEHGQKQEEKFHLGPKKIAVLARNSSTLSSLSDILQRYQIPYRNFSLKNDSSEERRCTAIVLQLLELMLHRGEKRSSDLLKPILHSGLFGLSLEEIQELVDNPLLKKQLLEDFLEWGKDLFERKISFLNLFEKINRLDWNPWMKEKDFQERLTRGEDLALSGRSQEWSTWQKIFRIFHQKTQTQTLEDLLYELALKDTISTKKDEEHIDENHVALMTIHQSKGLDFDIVFLLSHGSLISKAKKKSYTYYYKNGQKIFDFWPSKNHFEDHLLAVWEEEKRLYYVALTRARCAAFVVLPSLDTLRTKDLDIYRLLLNPFDSQGYLSRYSQQWKYDVLMKLHTSNSELYGQEFLPQEEGIPQALSEKITEKITSKNHLIPPQKSSWTQALRKNTLHLTSYSSLLGRFNDHEPQKIQLDPSAEEFDKLPQGRLFGLAVHKIFEKISWEKIGLYSNVEDWIHHEKHTQQKIFDILMDYLSNVSKAILNDVQRMIFHILTTRFHFLDIPLWQITKKQHELPFIFPIEKTGTFSSKEWGVLNTVKIPQGYLQGTIDLVFEHQDTIWLIDWKTKFLGNRLEDYHQEALRQNAQRDHYFLQSALYSYALGLSQKKQQGISKKHFGGFAIIFTRAFLHQRQESEGYILCSAEEGLEKLIEDFAFFRKKGTFS